MSRDSSVFNTHLVFHTAYLALFVIVLTLLLPVVTQASWKSQKIASDASSTLYPSLALDLWGQPHVLFCTESGNLVYSGRVNKTWTSKTIGSSCDGRITVDAQGHPHICYYDSVSEDLRYAYHTNFGWYDVAMGAKGSTGRAGENCVIKIDSSGFPRFIYYVIPDTDNTLNHMYWVPAGGYGYWNDEIMITNPSVSDGTLHMVLDSNDLPHVSYYAVDNEVMYLYKSFLGGTWYSEIVSPGGEEWGHETPIVLDQDGKVHIAFFDYGNGWNGTGTLRRVVAQRDGFGNWTQNIVEQGSGVLLGGVSGIDLNSSGFSAIAYEAGGNLFFQTYNGTSWSKQVVDTSIKTSGQLAINTHNRPHIIYIKQNGNIYHAEAAFSWNLVLPAIMNRAP